VKSLLGAIILLTLVCGGYVLLYVWTSPIWALGIVLGAGTLFFWLVDVVENRL
jgi:hypothetical protein